MSCHPSLSAGATFSKKKKLTKTTKNRSFIRSHLQRPSGIFCHQKKSAPGGDASPSSQSVFQVSLLSSTSRVDAGFCIRGCRLPSASRFGQSRPFQLDCGAGRSRGCRGEERILSEEEDGLLPLPSGKKTPLILPSVDGDNPAEQKKKKRGFCHTSRTSNGINVCVSA